MKLTNKNRKATYFLGCLFFISFLFSCSQNNTKLTEQNNSNFNFLPTSTTSSIVNHKYYTLSYSEKYEQAEWIAYELTEEQIVYTKRKRPYFEQDPKVKTGSADWKNFKNSGYTKGHLLAAADRKFSTEAYNETFLTSNVSPQLYKFNAGVWNRLEEKTIRTNSISLQG